MKSEPIAIVFSFQGLSKATLTKKMAKYLLHYKLNHIIEEQYPKV